MHNNNLSQLSLAIINAFLINTPQELQNKYAEELRKYEKDLSSAQKEKDELLQQGGGHSVLCRDFATLRVEFTNGIHYSRIG